MVPGEPDDVAIPDVDPYDAPVELLHQVSRAVAVRYSVFPIGVGDEGQILLACNDVLSPHELAAVADAIGRPVELCLATQSDVSFAIRRGYDRIAGPAPVGVERPRLGARLLARRIITEGQLCEALRKQRAAYSRLGDILVSRGALSAEDLARAVREFLAEGSGRLGEFLIARGYVAARAVEDALEEQRRQCPRLGEILVELGYVGRVPEDD